MLRTLMNSRRTAPLAAIGALTALALVTWSCGGSAGTTSYSNPITTTQTDSAIDRRRDAREVDGRGQGQRPARHRRPRGRGLRGHPRELHVDHEEAHPGRGAAGLGERAEHDPRGGPRPGHRHDAGGAADGRARAEARHRRVHHDRAHHPEGTRATASTYQPSVAYWTFRYWGFPRERVKMLNGGDDAWEVAGRPLTDAAARADALDLQRDRQQGPEGHASLLGGRDADARRLSSTGTAASSTPWQMLDVRGFTVVPVHRQRLPRQRAVTSS